MSKQEMPKPPAWAGNWIDRYCDPYLAEGIKGDLLELFEQEVQSSGFRKARRKYVFRALGFLRPTFKRKTQVQYSTTLPMWKNHFVTAFRSLKRSRQYFVINTFGLSIALCCALLAGIFTLDELSFDRQHAKAENIYRLYKTYKNPETGSSIRTAETSGMMGPTLLEEYPEVRSFLRIKPWFDPVIVSKDERHFMVDKFVFADSTFFQFFDFKLKAGNPTSALKEPASIVLSESLSRKLFGEDDPMGQSVTGVHDEQFIVTGIIADAPRNSHLQYDALVSWTTTVPNVGPLNYSFLNNWLAQVHYTYLLISPATDIAALEKKIEPVIPKYLPERADQYFLHLQPFQEVYLSSHEILGSSDLKMGSRRFLMILVLTGILVLLIASFNYINISLAKATRNLKEVGVRKVIGSDRAQIIARFIAEAFIQVTLALLISYLLLLILLPEFNLLSGKDVPLNWLWHWKVLVAALVFAVFVSLLVGVYPALIVSTAKPSVLLKNSLSHVRVGLVRKMLLVVQYAICTSLIVGTWIIYSQTQHLIGQTQNIKGDQVVVINLNNEVGEKSEAFVNLIKSHPNVLSVSHGRAAIGSGSFGTTVIPEGSTGIFNTRLLTIDHAFFETYGIQLKEGNLFRPGFASDSGGLVVNETFVKQMGWEAGVGKKVKFNEADTLSYPIIGVVEDFHTLSPARYKIEPAVMYMSANNRYNLSIRTGPGNMAATIDFFEESWNQFADKTPFDYYFVNEWYEQQFRAEMQMLDAATVFALLSIFLCILGLFGLTSILLEQRLRELSIRKVLGAGTFSLVMLINRQFIPLVLIALILAGPLCWFFGQKWLNTFAYQAGITVIPFLLSAFLTLLLTAATVSLLTVRSSHLNPVSALKAE